MENMDKIRLLRSIYGDISLISHDTFVQYSDDGIKILSLDCEELDNGDKLELSIAGQFGIHKYDKEIIITNYSEHKSIKIQREDNMFKELRNYENLGESFLMLNTMSRRDFRENYTIYNANLDVVAILRNCSSIYIYKENPVGCWFSYRYGFNPNRSHAYANKISKRIEIFDSVEINKDFSLISTELEKVDWASNINDESLPILRYKLAVGGTAVGNKSYSDIIRRLNMKNSNYFLSVETAIVKDRIYYGIIDKDGNELLEPLYDDIEYLGEELFILKSNGSQLIYDVAKRQIIFGYGTISKIIDTTVLPITLVLCTDNSWWVVTRHGEVFRYEDLSKHFECYYSKENPNILKIVLSNNSIKVDKFVDRQLTPITNIKKISEYSMNTWVRF